MLTSGTSTIWLVSGRHRQYSLTLVGSGTSLVDGHGQAHCWVLRDRVLISLDGPPPHGLPLEAVSVDEGGGFRPLLENYTVDASILVVN